MNPEIIEVDRFLVVGVRGVGGTKKGVMLPLLERNLFPRLGEISAAVETNRIYCVFGPIPNGPPGVYEYVAGLRTPDLDGIPEGMAGWDIAGGGYAVGVSAGIDDVGRTYAGIVDSLADSDYERRDTPWFMAFDRSLSPSGGAASWTVHVPVRSKASRSDLDRWA